MPEIWLLCEGDSDGPVLASVLTAVLAAEIIPKPSGGSSNAASAAEYVARHHAVTAAYVIDRDYRRRAIADATYTDGKRGFMWRRHAIESYLLEPAVIARALQRLKASMVSVPGGGPAWVRALPEDPAVIAEGLRACAAARAPEEAGRLAVERLWEELSDTAGRIQKRVPEAPPDGAGLDAAAHRQAFLHEAERLIGKAQETAASPHLTAAALGQRYDQELENARATAYLADLRFLEDFRGKDLLSAFLAWLRREHHSSLSYKRLVTELEQAVPIVYRSNRLVYRTDDFLDLANGVRALAGLPPV
jgi:hypothetical protein